MLKQESTKTKIIRRRPVRPKPEQAKPEESEVPEVVKHILSPYWSAQFVSNNKP